MVIWDRITRLLHWVIAASMVLNLLVLEEGDPPHAWVGYVAVVAVGLRFIWGFFGAPQSRFAQWPLSWSEIRMFVLEEKAGTHRAYPGHNPLACLVYFAIWFSVIALAITGVMMGTDRFWGEEWLMDLHKAISLLVQSLILLHALGFLLDSYKLKRKTWLAMISGQRPPFKS